MTDFGQFFAMTAGQAPRPPGQPPGAPQADFAPLEQMARAGVVPAEVHRRVLDSHRQALRQMLARHAIDAPENATFSQLIAICDRRLALVDFHENAD